MQHMHFILQIPMLNCNEISATPPWWGVLATAAYLNHWIHIVEKENFLKEIIKLVENSVRDCVKHGL